MTPSAQMHALEAGGPQAAHIEVVWWVMLWVTAAVYVAVMGFLFYALVRRRREGDRDSAAEWKRTYWVASAAVASAAILFGLLIVSVLAGRATAQLSGAGGIQIQITGRQWWWQVEYVTPEPDRRVQTANEIHIPAGVPVLLTLRSSDVIHSFWIPSLHGKRDLIPGEDTTLTLRADRPGVYRGQCAEFCGLQHAHMALFVYADPPDVFARWYAQQLNPAAEPATPEQHKGRSLFLESSCVMCHQIRGTDAAARFGPDLTHLASRRLLAAGTLPNTRPNLGAWISNPHAAKPGVKMPRHAFANSELNALTDYLGSLR